MNRTFVSLCLLLIVAVLAVVCYNPTNACTSVKTDECPRLFHKVRDEEDSDAKRLWVKTQFALVNSMVNTSGKCKKAMKDYICASNYTRCDISGTHKDVCRSVCNARAKECGLSSDDCKDLPLVKCSGRVNASSASTIKVSILAIVLVAIASLMI